MPSHRAIWTGAIGLIVLGMASPAVAAPMLFTDRSAFDQVAVPNEVVTFEGLPLGPVCLPVSPFVSAPCRLTLDGVTFADTIGDPGSANRRPELVLDRGLNASTFLLPGTAIPRAADDFSLTFSGRVIGLDVATFATFGWPVAFRFTEVDGTQTSTTLFVPLPGTFLGATSDVGFTQLSLYAQEIDGGLTNFEIDNVALKPIPEPATLLLCVTTAAGLGLVRRLRCRASDCEHAA